MDINSANLNNLKTLWKKYGSELYNDFEAPIIINKSWPHRCWLELSDTYSESQATKTNNPDIASLLNSLPRSAIIPLWTSSNTTTDDYKGKVEYQFAQNLLTNKSWQCEFKQTAMYLDLKENAFSLSPQSTGLNLQIKTVKRLEDIPIWTGICRDAFGYDIDNRIIEHLIGDKTIQIILGYLNNQAVSCGFLFKTGDTVGIHQMGVSTAFQGKGIALAFMQSIIKISATLKSKHIVLQASELGKPLYEKLGFKEQFIINNYVRV
jgi:ribosomal protein S18 acetylase RimI-like enzyme